ncbi:MAG: winged helix-turn-helix domain-containing protein [Acidobacteria bacterium]|nr:winged helix-turn-helix domain-containing protein [Acidobacteriota bacterium]
MASSKYGRVPDTILKEQMNDPAYFLYQFGPFRLDPQERLLWRTDEIVWLTPKAFDTLLVLLENSGQLVSKDDLMDRVWPNTYVEEANLAQNVSTLRKALGENSDGIKYIETLPRRGYRFVAPVQKIPAEKSIPDKSEELPPSTEDTASTPDPSHPVTPIAEGQTTKPQRARILFIGLAMLFVVLLVGVFLAFKWQQKNSPQARRLAVLPFRNLKPDAATDYLGFPLADAIITKLGYVSALTVKPSSYVSQYRNQEFDVRKAATDLNVDTLLVGSYLKEESHLRVTAQLIDVVADRLLWKDEIDLKDTGQLILQDRVAQEIIRGLHLSLTSAESARLQRDVPDNAQAYEFYLRGVDLYASNEFNLATQMLEQSVRLSPNYPLAWAHLGRAHTAKAAFEFGGEEYYRKAQSDYEKALSLNPDLIEARIFMANLFTDTGRVEQAVPLLREALATNPNHPEAHWELGYAYRFGGMLKESIAEGERARQLDPEVKLNSSAFNSYFYDGQYEKFLSSLPTKTPSAFIMFYRGLGHYYLKNWERAMSDFDDAYQSNPTSLYIQIGHALRLHVARQTTQGLEQLRAIEQQVERQKVTDAEALYKVAQAFAELGDKSAALRLLRRSIEGGFFCYPYFVNDPLLSNLRGEAEYTKLLEIARQRHEEFKRQFFAR